MGIVKVNVAGTVFEVDSEIFATNEDQRTLRGKLPNLVTDAAKYSTGLAFQRPVNSFAAILEYYQTGMLHIPNSVCPASFKHEMDFWEIEETVLQACCRSKYVIDLTRYQKMKIELCHNSEHWETTISL